MDTIIVAKGNGYEGCTAFDGYAVIADPLPKREDRVYHPPGHNFGVCYGSHEVRLAKRTDYPGRDLYILMAHGGGRCVVRLKPCADAGDTEAALVALPPRVLYSLLYAIATGAEQADREARSQTARDYASAFVEGRLSKSRARRGRRDVVLEQGAMRRLITVNA